MTAPKKPSWQDQSKRFRIDFECSRFDAILWERRAKELGISRSEWMRRTLNRDCIGLPKLQVKPFRWRRGITPQVRKKRPLKKTAVVNPIAPPTKPLTPTKVSPTIITAASSDGSAPERVMFSSIRKGARPKPSRVFPLVD